MRCRLLKCLYMHVSHAVYKYTERRGTRQTEKPERKSTQNVRKWSVQCRADGENEVYKRTVTVPAEKNICIPLPNVSHVGTNPF